MHRTDHALHSQSLGSHKTLSSFHFGTVGARPKVYIQASLHAEELPGMLAAYHLRHLLEQAEAQGQIQGEIILVPVANPIGLAQRVDHKPMGRFELNSSENFNRHYPDFCAAVLPQLQNELRDTLGTDPAHNVRTVRQAVAAWLHDWQPATELASQRKTLVSLAFDADVVLDLHCDCEAVLHLYTETPCWPTLEPLARLLGAQAVLLAQKSGGLSFDESLSGLWWQLADALGPAFPIPQACCSTTVELRGEGDVGHAWAKADAQAIFGYLQHLDVVAGPAPALPDLACAATPLSGAQVVRSPVPGVLVFAIQPGNHVALGALVAEVINPITDTVYALRAEVPGVLYARIHGRYATPGEDLAHIAGKVPFRTGNLLGA